MEGYNFSLVLYNTTLNFKVKYAIIAKLTPELIFIITYFFNNKDGYHFFVKNQRLVLG